MNVLGKKFLNSRKDRQKDGKTERHSSFCEMQKNVLKNINNKIIISYKYNNLMLESKQHS